MGNAIAVIGSTTIDTVVQGKRRTLKCGGVTTYAGLAAQRLGYNTAVATRIAPADDGILDPLRAQGIAVHSAPSPQTTRFVNYVDGDQRQQQMPAAAAPIGPELMRQALKANVLLLGPLHPDDIDPQALDLTRGAAGPVALDLQGYVRRVIDGRVHPEVSPRIDQALSVTRILKADQNELAAVLAFYDCDLPTLTRHHGLDEILVTKGSQGGIVFTAAGQTFDYAAHPLQNPGDPTGAGDVFFAAYLCHRLFRQDPAPQAAAAAARTAALQIEGRFIPPDWLLLEPGANPKDSV